MPLRIGAARAGVCTYNGLPSSKFGGELWRGLRKGPVRAWGSNRCGESLPKFNPADRCRRSQNQELSVIAGGPAPLIATWLFGTYHSPYAIAVYIAACAVLSLIATALMTGYTGKDIAGEYAT